MHRRKGEKRDDLAMRKNPTVESFKFSSFSPNIPCKGMEERKEMPRPYHHVRIVSLVDSGPSFFNLAGVCLRNGNGQGFRKIQKKKTPFLYCIVNLRNKDAKASAPPSFLWCFGLSFKRPKNSSSFPLSLSVPLPSKFHLDGVHFGGSQWEPGWQCKWACLLQFA